jgi:hypothetical protein
MKQRYKTSGDSNVKQEFLHFEDLLWNNKKMKKNLAEVYIIISLFCARVCVCVCVWSAIDSVSRGNTDMIRVSLKQVGPEDVEHEKIFPEKWPVTKWQNKNFMPLMIFYGKIYIYFRLFWTGSRLAKNKFVYTLSEYL